jgi:sugar fermentation stimulation protein A
MLVIFPSPLLPAILLRRYQRFLADVQLADGRTVTVHCPNTGALLGCAEPGMAVWLSRSSKPGRKYALTWELVNSGGTLVGINTGLANRLVEEALHNHLLPGFTGYPQLRREVRYGQANSRIDFLLEGDDHNRCYLEVKNVTAAVQDGIALFPDAVSQRGTRHLRELITVVAQGQRAVLCFCVQRQDVREVRPADAINPVYGATLREALACGVEVMACAAVVTSQAITLHRRLPVVCP